MSDERLEDYVFDFFVFVQCPVSLLFDLEMLHRLQYTVREAEVGVKFDRAPKSLVFVVVDGFVVDESDLDDAGTFIRVYDRDDVDPGSFGELECLLDQVDFLVVPDHADLYTCFLFLRRFLLLAARVKG